MYKKDALFLGASNTFGVGLHTFRQKYMTEEGAKTLTWPWVEDEHDYRYIESMRWSRLVSDYLHRNEINVSTAGGSPAESLYKLQTMDLTNIDYIFFELSAFYSYFDPYFHNQEHPRTPHEIEAFLTNGKNDRQELRESILRWLTNYDPQSFIHEVLTAFKEKIDRDLKNKKLVILFWREIGAFKIKKYSWLEDYIIKFPLLNNPDNFLVSEWLIENQLRVCDEHPLRNIITGNPHNNKCFDTHPGPMGCQVLAQIIINYINETKDK